MFLGRPDVGGETAAYARDAVLWYEWEGFPEGPLEEADFAKTYLRGHAASRIKPYLDLFLLHRYRAAYEAADWSSVHPPNGVALDLVLPRWRELGRRAAEGYNRIWMEVQRNGGVLENAVAKDIDAAGQLYVGPAGHPRRRD